MRKAFIDLGANTGGVSSQFAKDDLDLEIFAFEPNPELEPNLEAVKAWLGERFNYFLVAAWIRDGEINLYKSDHPMASTVLEGKIEPDGWNPIDYSSFTSVRCIDISTWIDEHFQIGDDVIMKIDVEGAEYQIMQKMIYDGTIFKVRKIICEWHPTLFPHRPWEEHEMIYDKVARCVQLEDWI